MNQKFLGIILAGLLVGTSQNVSAQYAGATFYPIVMDIGGAVGRILSTGVKYFLGDDTGLVADLVWDDSAAEGNGGCGGCGGCYGGEPDATAGGGGTSLSAQLGDISLTTDLYTADAIRKSCVADLAQQRLDGTVVQRSSLDKLSDEDWMIMSQSQRRAIQAMTDALNMKRLYNDIKDVAESTPSSYTDYSAAMSSIASKRLLLDQLLALKKRVIAARVRTRAQTLEVSGVDLESVTVPPDFTNVCLE